MRLLGGSRRTRRRPRSSRRPACETATTRSVCCTPATYGVWRPHHDIPPLSRTDRVACTPIRRAPVPASVSRVRSGDRIAAQPYPRPRRHAGGGNRAIVRAIHSGSVSGRAPSANTRSRWARTISAKIVPVVTRYAFIVLKYARSTLNGARTLRSAAVTLLARYRQAEAGGPCAS